MIMETNYRPREIPRELIIQILREKIGKWVELSIDNPHKVFFHYGIVMSVDDDPSGWVYFYDREDGKTAFRIKLVLKVRDADPGMFKISIKEFDIMADAKLGLKDAKEKELKKEKKKRKTKKGKARAGEGKIWKTRRNQRRRR
jgi:hypothetical protein